MSENRSLRIKLFFKKIRDMKLKVKLRIFLFATTILSVIGIGSYSYWIARNELIQNTRDSVLSIEKQGANHLDDRIQSFQDTSYRIIQSANIERLLEYSPKEAAANRVANEGLPAAISQQASLFGYIKYALLRPNSGMVYDYYKSGQHKLTPSVQNELLDTLDEHVSRNHAVCWIPYGNEVYFVRQIVDLNFQEKGILIFALDESFFQFFTDDIEYLNDEDTIVINREGNILKCKNEEIAEHIFESMAIYQKQHYYIYNYTEDIKNDVYTVTVINARGSGWIIITHFSHSLLLRSINHIYVAMLEIILLVIFLVLIITSWVNRLLTKNMVIIENGMKQYETGHFEHRIRPVSYDEVGLLGLQLNYMAVKISELIQQLHTEEENKKKMEIATLQAQINPHFLYNTLGSLKWAAYRQGQKDIAASLDALVNLLRFTIKKAGGMVSVEEEMDYIRNYIAIEKVRYGECFEVQYKIEEEVKHYPILGFILQPLVENSLLHGLDLTKENARITIRAYQKSGFLFLEVEDNGTGISKEHQEILFHSEQEEHYKGFSSIGLKIVDRRLHEIYGEHYHTGVISESGLGTKIVLEIPLEEKNNAVERVDR